MKKVIHLLINQPLVVNQSQKITKTDTLEILFSTLSNIATKEKCQLIIIAPDSQQQFQAVVFKQEEASWILEPYNQNPAISNESIILSSLLVSEGVLVIDDRFNKQWFSSLQLIKDIKKPLIVVAKQPTNNISAFASTLIVDQICDIEHKDVWVVLANSDIVLNTEQLLIPSYQTKTRTYTIIAPLFGLAYLSGLTRYNRVDACVFAAKLAAITYDQYFE